MPKNAAVIQAAGKGSRFQGGMYKLLTPVDGKPMILKTLEPVLQTGFDEVVVVIGAHSDEMRNILVNYPVKIIENKGWEQGQSTSLAAGVRAVETTSDRACLMLGDQPFLKASTLRELLTESENHPDEVIVPMYGKKRGNPIVVPSYRYALLLELTRGDVGGRQLLETVGYRGYFVDDPGVIRDIDTVNDICMKDEGGTKLS